MNKIIISITAVLIAGTSFINLGTDGINTLKISDITKVYAKETDDTDTTPEVIQCDNNLYCTITDGGSTMTITGKGHINYIPYEGSKIKKLIVENGITNISPYAFLEYKNLESISLPDSVNYICNGVFDNTAWYNNAGKVAYTYKGQMKENTDLTFKDGTTGIAEQAFCDCSEINSVTFPDTITTIPYLSFCNCKNLTSVTIPDSVTDIGVDAFYGCRSLEKIIIPDNVTDIGSAAFKDCFLLEDITFPDSIPYMGDSVFDETAWYYNQPPGIIYAGKTVCGCKDWITDVVIKEGTESIADGAFENCTYIKSVQIPDSVTNTGCNIFKGCTSLENITFSNSMTSINNYSFGKCDSLKSVTIPENIKYIGSGAFSENYELESITFLSKDLDIDYYAFGGVPNLREVFYVGSEEDWKQKVSIDLDNQQLSEAYFHFIYSACSDQTNPVLYGDINGDNIIDITDLIELSSYLLKDTILKGKFLMAADVSGNGNVDIIDLAVLRQYICHDDVKLGPKV